MIKRLWNAFQDWRLRRWIARHTMKREELECELERLYGIPREHKVQ